MHPAPAAAQKEAPCPASIRPITGGLGDATSDGYDDGAHGADEIYVPGELIVGLQPDANLADLRCLAGELGAAIVGGGVGNRGLGGIDDVVVLQLGPRASVIRTRDLLRQPRYAHLVVSAQENTIVEPKAIPTVNDPLYPLQWGVWNVGQLPPEYAESLPANPIITTMPAQAKRFSMRMPMAWQLLTRKPVLAPVGLAIIDDSLVQHADLEQNVSQSTSAKFDDGQGIGNAVQKIQVAPGSMFAVVRDGIPGCQLEAAASAAALQSVLLRRYAVFCAVPDTTTMLLSITATGGTLVVAGPAQRSGRQSIPTRTSPLPFDIPAADLQQALAGLNGIGVGQVDVKLEQAAGPRTYRVTISKPNVPISVDAANLTGPNAAANVAAEALQVTDTGVGAWSVRFGIPPAQALTLTPAGAGNTVNAASGIKITTSRWPGQNEPGSSTHGQNIAGMIGATANNGQGITGVLGPRTNVRIAGLVYGTGSNAEIVEAIRYATEDIDARVVNMSLGWGRQKRPPLLDPRKPDPMAPDAVNQALGNVSPNSRTLFVVAASNEATNVNDPGPRNADPQYRQDNQGRWVPVPTDLYPCRPKGNGITQRPPDDVGPAQDKGGRLSRLQMPDGTYDRGNLLCVGAVQENGMVAAFSMWGRNIIDVGAPGTRIIGTNASGGYDSGQGTSYAAPYVAAVAAMVYEVYPNSQPWLVKCAILSSATSQQLPAQNGAALPFRSYAAGNDPTQFDPNQVFTVHGMVTASEALSAAGALTSKVAAAQAGTGAWPTCVQKRRKSFFQAAFGRPGSWRDTPIAP